LVTRIDDPGRARLVKVERPAQPRDSATRASAPGARHSARPLSVHAGACEQLVERGNEEGIVRRAHTPAAASSSSRLALAAHGCQEPRL